MLAQRLGRKARTICILIFAEACNLFDIFRPLITIRCVFLARAVKLTEKREEEREARDTHLY